ncbi:MAG: LysR family transcriptional regulator [Eggerthellaceae bacterium]|nr:LysR family transcriptional regulator [Eggerthellaceae bacterium]
MHIERLREFVTLGHTCSFKATAKVHYITEATLSKHISGIEATVGAKLFVRDTHHVRLTAVGEEFLRDVEALMEEYDGALMRVRALASSMYLARVGYLSDAMGGLLPATLKWMAENRPEMNVKLTAAESGALASGLAGGRYNIILSMDLDEDLRRRCHFLKLREDVFCVATSLAHPLADRETVTPDDLAQCQLLLPDSVQMAPMHQRLRAIVGRPLDECDVARVCYDMSSVILLAEAGVGVGVVPRFMERQYRGRMRFIPLREGPGVRFDLGALWLRGKDEDLARPMVDALREVAFRP